jgi:hypothetical protein
MLACDMVRVSGEKGVAPDFSGDSARSLAAIDSVVVMRWPNTRSLNSCSSFRVRPPLPRPDSGRALTDGGLRVNSKGDSVLLFLRGALSTESGRGASRLKACGWPVTGDAESDSAAAPLAPLASAGLSASAAASGTSLT